MIKKIEKLKSISNIHVVGLSSVEGANIIRFLVKIGVTKITAHDFCKEVDFEKNLKKFNPNSYKEILKDFKKIEIKKFFIDDYLNGIESAGIIFLPQAWYKYDFNCLKIPNALKKGVIRENMLNLYLTFSKAKTIGITGSQGKSTITRMLYEVLKGAKKDAYLVGNDRSNNQVLHEIMDIPNSSYLILEVSNRHLKNKLDVHPDIALISNIYPNHLDEHDSYKQYAETKINIIGKESEKVFINKEIFKTFKSIIPKNNFIEIVDLNEESDFDLKIKGKFNNDNAVMVSKIASYLGIKKAKTKEILSSFIPLKGRMELITTKRGISFFNDIKSTTPCATKAAVDSFDKKPYLIVGGNDKKLEYDDLCNSINQKVKFLCLLPGSASEKIKKLIDTNQVKIKEVASLKQSIDIIFSEAEKGDCILLSPAGENFYSNFVRGKLNIKDYLNKFF